MPNHRVAIVAGARTPFVKAGLAFSSLGPLALAKQAMRGLLDRHDVDPSGIATWSARKNHAVRHGVAAHRPECHL